MPFVVDASATLPWCFEDEATDWSEALLTRLSTGELASAPSHWTVEVSNALLMAIRRKRIETDQAEWFLEKLSSFSVTVESPLSPDQVKAVFAICLKHKLTFYDEAYLELSRRTGLPLATLDEALRKAARQEAVPLIE